MTWHDMTWHTYIHTYIYILAKRNLRTSSKVENRYGTSVMTRISPLATCTRSSTWGISHMNHGSTIGIQLLDIIGIWMLENGNWILFIDQNKNRTSPVEVFLVNFPARWSCPFLWGYFQIIHYIKKGFTMEINHPF